MMVTVGVGWPLGPRPHPPMLQVPSHTLPCEQWARVAAWSKLEVSAWWCSGHPLPQDSHVQWGLPDPYVAVSESHGEEQSWDPP